MAASKPVITPDAFTGVGSWDEWIDHFECVADVNKWETNAEKLKWLKVRLTGRAIKAFRQLPEAARADYKQAKKALGKRFEPESRKEYYIAELQTRRRRKGEDWATFGEELKSIADKAYPDLEVKAREQLALNQYLSSIGNPQVAFSVRQQRPTTVEKAVTTTMEMESYLGPKTGCVAQVDAAGSSSIGQPDEEPDAGVAAVAKNQDTTLELLQKITDRLDKLEFKSDGGSDRSRSKRVICWNCRKEGHLARNCRKPRRPQRPGREKSDAVNTVGHTITAFSADSKSGCHLQGSVNGIGTNFLVDTGAAATLLSIEVWNRIQASSQVRQKPKLDPCSAADKLSGVQGSPLQLHGKAQVQIEFAKETFDVQVIVVESLTTEAILGRDFLVSNNCVVNVGKHLLHFENHRITVSLDSPPDGQQIAHVSVILDDTLQIPPRSEVEVMAKIPEVATGGTWLVEGSQKEHNAVLVARAVVTPERREVPVRLLNVREEQITVKGGTTIAQMDAVQEEHVTSTISAIQESGGAEIPEEKRQLLWEVVMRSGENLSEPEREQLFSLLLDYDDIFASSPDDFGRTGRIKHTIDTGNSPPVRQPVRRIPPIRREESHNLLQGMLDKEVIKPSTSPWASPIVLVQKTDRHAFVLITGK